MKISIPTLNGLSRRQRLLLSLAAGCLVAFALPPFSAVPLLLVLIPVFMVMISRSQSVAEAFFTGCAFGFGMFVSGLYWIAWALTVDLAAFWWLIPFAVAGLPAFLALFTGLVAAIWWALPLRDPVARAFAFAVIFCVSEWLRGVLLTGFPWNLLGYGWTAWTPVIQSASVIGIHGLSFLTVLVAALPFGMMSGTSGPDHNLYTRTDHRRSMIATTIGLGLFVVLAIGGLVRLSGDAGSGQTNDVILRLVQPNIAQGDKWDRSLWPEFFDRHLTMSRENADGVTHVIWPETAIPYFLGTDNLARSMIAESVPPGGLIITGSPRLEGDWDDPDRRIFNSLWAIDANAGAAGYYDKFHLVPFGEYVPFRSVLPIDKITPGRLDFSPGPGPQTLTLPGLPPVGPLICYEVIFPGRIIDADNRPSWLLNLTNDAWYGHTSGPYQHFAIARVRAVEEGLPMVRVANTGISGVIDAAGRVTASLGLGHQGVIDAALPEAWPSRTIFSLTGHWGFLGLLLLGSACAVVINRFRHRI